MGINGGERLGSQGALSRPWLAFIDVFDEIAAAALGAGAVTEVQLLGVGHAAWREGEKIHDARNYNRCNESHRGGPENCETSHMPTFSRSIF